VGGVLLQTNSLGITHITLSQAWPMFIIVVGLMVVAHSLSERRAEGPRPQPTPISTPFTYSEAAKGT